MVRAPSGIWQWDVALSVRSIKLSALPFISFLVLAIGGGGEWKLAFADKQAVCCLES